MFGIDVVVIASQIDEIVAQVGLQVHDHFHGAHTLHHLIVHGLGRLAVQEVLLGLQPTVGGPTLPVHPISQTKKVHFAFLQEFQNRFAVHLVLQRSGQVVALGVDVGNNHSGDALGKVDNSGILTLLRAGGLDGVEERTFAFE